MSYLFTNLASSTLASGVGTGDLSLSVSAGDGALFPSPSGSDFFLCTMINTSGNSEIVKVTARSTDTFTIVRAQESTTATAFSAGDLIELRATAGYLGTLANKTDIQEGNAVYATGGGTADVQTVTLSPVPASYTDGMEVRWLPTANNAGAATLNVNSLGAIAIKKIDSSGTVVDLAAGDLDSDVPAIGIYRAAATPFFLLVNPLAIDTSTFADTATANVYTKTETWKQGADVASASALAVDIDGNMFDVTGTTAITSMNTKGVGTLIVLQFDAALVLTHHATNLILPGGANITTAAGDTGTFYEYATGDWRCVNYSKASGAPVAGSVAQVVSTETGAVATGTTTMPTDDTIPQNTEGDQYMSLAITPKSATNNLIIRVTAILASNVGGRMSVALFQDATANALASAIEAVDNTNRSYTIVFTHKMAAGTTSATTFKVRAGNDNAGTTTFNGTSGARIHGGVLASSIIIEEHAT